MMVNYHVWKKWNICDEECIHSIFITYMYSTKYNMQWNVLYCCLTKCTVLEKDFKKRCNTFKNRIGCGNDNVKVTKFKSSFAAMKTWKVLVSKTAVVLGWPFLYLLVIYSERTISVCEGVGWSVSPGVPQGNPGRRSCCRVWGDSRVKPTPLFRRQKERATTGRAVAPTLPISTLCPSSFSVLSWWDKSLEL